MGYEYTHILHIIINPEEVLSNGMIIDKIGLMGFICFVAGGFSGFNVLGAGRVD